MSAFKVSGEDIDRIFFTEQELVERFTGVALWGWGDGGSGAASWGWFDDISSPRRAIGDNKDWKILSSSSNHGAAIKTDGTLWTWGSNFAGQIGDGTTNTAVSPVTTAGGGTNWRHIGIGDFHNVGIKTDGTAWTWGQNFSAQLGIGSFDAGRSSPVTILGGITDWVTSAAGRKFSAAIRSTGQLYTWGGNDNNSLGDGTSFAQVSPVTTSGGGTNWKHVACGYEFGAGIKTDGTLWMWGRNDKGQLGDGTTTNRSSPITTAGGGTDWKSVALYYLYSAAIKTDGTLWTWGTNSSGQLGDGSTTSRSSPATVAGGGTTWKQVACGYRHMLGIKTDGTLWSWGLNDNGQLGTGNTTNRSSPGTVATNSTWKQVACGYKFSLGLAEF